MTYETEVIDRSLTTCAPCLRGECSSCELLSNVSTAVTECGCLQGDRAAHAMARAWHAIALLDAGEETLAHRALMGAAIALGDKLARIAAQTTFGPRPRLALVRDVNATPEWMERKADGERK